MQAAHIPGIPYLEIVKGRIEGHSVVHKFGAGLLNTSLEPITYDKTYPTPTAAVSLEFLSDDAADNSAGIGVRKITVEGLDSNWDEIIQTKETNGLTPVVLDTPIIRLNRWMVSPIGGSGTYATESAGSHQGNLTLRVEGGGATWSTLPSLPFPVGQSQIGVYSIKKGYTGYLIKKNIVVSSTKAADIYFFQRPNADIITAPYAPMRLFEREVGVSGVADLSPFAPKGPLVGPCDVGFMGLISVGTAECSVKYELLIVEDRYTNP
jgi:hypothetical protein